jgi:hypothetical protein
MLVWVCFVKQQRWQHKSEEETTSKNPKGIYFYCCFVFFRINMYKVTKDQKMVLLEVYCMFFIRERWVCHFPTFTSKRSFHLFFPFWPISNSLDHLYFFGFIRSRTDFGTVILFSICSSSKRWVSHFHLLAPASDFVKITLFCKYHFKIHFLLFQCVYFFFFVCVFLAQEAKTLWIEYVLILCVGYQQQKTQHKRVSFCVWV